MSLDLAALAILGFFFLIGAWRGFAPSLLGLVALVLGYVGAVLAAKFSGPPVGAMLELPTLLAAPLVGTAGFFATVICFRLLTAPLRRSDRERAAAVGRGAGDRLLGGCLGSLRGAVIVVLLALLATWLDAARDLRDDTRLARVPQTEDSIAAAVSTRALEAAVHAAVGSEGAGTVAGRFVTRPAVAIQAVESIANDPSIRSLQSDRLFWTYIEQGQAHNAVQRPAFRAFVANDDLRGQLAALGAIDDEARADPEIFRRDMQESLQKLGPKLRALREDPEVQELAQDPQVQKSIEAGDPWALISDARIHRIASRMAEDL